MVKTVETVMGLSDTEVVAVAKEFFGQVYRQVPYKDVLANAQSMAEVSTLAGLDNGVLQQDMSPEDSVRYGRYLLEEFARDDSLASVVDEACQTVRESDDLVIGVILAVGLVANLTLLAATTRVEISKGTDGQIAWKVVKKNASAKLVEKIINPFTALATSS